MRFDAYDDQPEGAKYKEYEKAAKNFTHSRIVGILRRFLTARDISWPTDDKRRDLKSQNYEPVSVGSRGMKRTSVTTSATIGGDSGSSNKRTKLSAH